MGNVCTCYSFQIFCGLLVVTVPTPVPNTRSTLDLSGSEAVKSCRHTCFDHFIARVAVCSELTGYPTVMSCVTTKKHDLNTCCMFCAFPV